MRYDSNPFPEADVDRHAIWEFMVRKDIDAYLAKDWSMVADDFIADNFMGIQANRSGNPDSWTLGFPTLDAYRGSWLAGTIEQADFAEALRPALFRCTFLRDIEIVGDKALAHKKFDGRIALAKGGSMEFKWQSIAYLCRQPDRWRVFGFTGYMPNPIAL
ncbi:MAG: hypothetical protein HY834_07035 [Devosia nanyangense]|uniref:Uncharacterized protein n=1 Tax=Devosia nanyangense TaxID=1228055 RepID=A0A933NYA5_9HYPH|nr:hypothetical protein [Devosia nanyangense]